MSPIYPRPALASFLGPVFSPAELVPWVYSNLHPLKDRVPGRAAIDELAIAVVELAAGSGLIDAAFFDVLRRRRQYRLSHRPGLGFERDQLLVATVVAGGLDDLASGGEVVEGGGGDALGEGETSVAEIGVGLVETVAAAGGDAFGFVEVLAGKVEGAGAGVQGGADEQAAGDILLIAGAPKAVDGSVEV